MIPGDQKDKQKLRRSLALNEETCILEKQVQSWYPECKYLVFPEVKATELLVGSETSYRSEILGNKKISHIYEE